MFWKYIIKVQSAQSEQKECACTTISNLVCQPGTASLFLKAGIVKVLGPLILEEHIGVRKGALGALRNLTTAGNCFEVCDEMVKEDIMTPVVALLQKVKIYIFWCENFIFEANCSIQSTIQFSFLFLWFA